MEINIDPALYYDDDFSCEREYAPSQSERYTVFIAGRQGCGKSVAASDFIRAYLPRETIVYLFSTQGREESYKFKNQVRKMKMVPSILAGITKEKIRADAGERPIMCLFDDVDMLPNEIAKPVRVLIEDLLANGRSHGPEEEHIHMIVTSHSPNDYSRTKKIMENSTYLVIFPKGVLRAQLETLLKKCGLPREYIQFISSLPQRRVLLKNSHPFQLIKF